MFALERTQVQGMADQAMAVAPCNVNVVDYSGFITGSGDANIPALDMENNNENRDRP
jgi:sugar diacid utilization regulator